MLAIANFQGDSKIESASGSPILKADRYVEVFSDPGTNFDIEGV